MWNCKLHLFWCTNVNMIWRQRTCVTNYVDQQTLNPFRLINVSECSTYLSVHCQRQSVSSCSHSSVEQSSITRHCCPPLSPSSAVVLNHISSHFLILLSDSSLICTVRAQWLVILNTIIAITFYILSVDLLAMKYQVMCIVVAGRWIDTVHLRKLSNI